MTNQYVTGAMIKRLREKRHLTQAELAEKICVTDKAVSKWETGRGLRFPALKKYTPIAIVMVCLTMKGKAVYLPARERIGYFLKADFQRKCGFNN